jgi:gamma-glutamyltranspeptidase/glutathione hydrolase
VTAARLPRPLVRGSRGACACGHPLGAAAAVEAIAAGGSAVDAAVAAAATLSVVLPEACGLGGEAMLLVAPAGAPPVALNGAGRSPAALQPPVPADGGGTVAVPAAVPAWLDAHARFGRLDLGRLLAPALRLAREGVPASASTLGALRGQRPRLERTAPGFPFLAAGLRPGARVPQPALARTLDLVARVGRDAFRVGPLAEAIARAVRADGGAMTPEDLARHATAVGAPVTAGRLGLELAVQPPRSQATLLPMALGALERSGAQGEAERAHVLVEALEAAFAHRDALAEPDAVGRLLAAELDVDPERAQRRGGPRDYAHTTAVCAADAEGLLVAMLISVFDDFGSAVLVPEGGFLLNDRLLGFTAPPNHARPGEAPVSTLSPALVADGERRLAIATPGADAQVQTLAQVLVAVAAGAGLPEAIERPRFRAVEGRLTVERDAGETLLAALRAKGHDVVELEPGDATTGAVAAAGIDRATGTPFAAADPRRETWAAAC